MGSTLSLSIESIKISECYYKITEYPNYKNSRKYSLLYHDDRYLTFLDVFNIISSELSTDEFIDTLTKQMNQFPYYAYFLEFPPITLNNYKKIPFEFMLIPSEELLTVEPDYSPFAKKFIKSNSCSSTTSNNQDNPSSSRSSFSQSDSNYNGVITFANLSGDSRLVVPCPYTENDQNINITLNFAHVAKFLKNANKELIRETWKCIVNEATKTMITDHNKKLWISTSGLGVSWIHFRLDSRPKYYHWDEYINA